MVTPDNLYQYALSPATVELAVKDLFRRAKVEFPAGYDGNDLAAHIKFGSGPLSDHLELPRDGTGYINEARADLIQIPSMS